MKIKYEPQENPLMSVLRTLVQRDRCLNELTKIKGLFESLEAIIPTLEIICELCAHFIAIVQYERD